MGEIILLETFSSCPPSTIGVVTQAFSSFRCMVVMGEISQHNTKLYNRVIGSGNKFFQTCNNLWGALIKYSAQDRN